MMIHNNQGSMDVHYLGVTLGAKESDRKVFPNFCLSFRIRVVHAAHLKRLHMSKIEKSLLSESFAPSVVSCDV